MYPLMPSTVCGDICASLLYVKIVVRIRKIGAKLLIKFFHAIYNFNLKFFTLYIAKKVTKQNLK